LTFADILWAKSVLSLLLIVYVTFELGIRVNPRASSNTPVAVDCYWHYWISPTKTHWTVV